MRHIRKISVITLSLFVSLIILNCNNKSTESILVGYDWVYPNINNPTGAWKFSDDGTFNYSTTMFGGNTRKGKWEDIGNSQIRLKYNDGKTGVVEITSKNTFKVGSTTYNRY